MQSAYLRYVCVFGGNVDKHWSNNLRLTHFLTITFSGTLIAFFCDRLTYLYVKENTFRRNQNQVGPSNHQHSIQAEDQGLSDHQKELLKIPLNAVRISLMSFLPLMILHILIVILGVGWPGDIYWCAKSWFRNFYPPPNWSFEWNIRMVKIIDQSDNI